MINKKILLLIINIITIQVNCTDIEKKENQEQNINQEFLEAIIRNDYDKVKFLLENNINNPNFNIETEIEEAYYEENCDTSSDTGIPFMNDTALILAVKQKNINLINLLLYYKPKFNITRDYWALAVAATINLDIVKILVNKYGKNIIFNNYTKHNPLYYAISERKIDTIKYLIDNGANVNSEEEEEEETGKEEKGKKEKKSLLATILHLYITDPNIVKLLIQNGAKIHPQDINENINDILLHTTNKCNNLSPALFDILIEMGADIKIKDDDHKTILSKFFYIIKKCNKNIIRDKISKTHINIVELLIKHGVNINSKDNDGNTSLHHLSFIDLDPEDYKGIKNKINIIKLLIYYGADPEITNNKDIKPVTDPEIASIYKQYKQKSLHILYKKITKPFITDILQKYLNINLVKIITEYTYPYNKENPYEISHPDIEKIKKMYIYKLIKRVLKRLKYNKDLDKEKNKIRNLLIKAIYNNKNIDNLTNKHATISNAQKRAKYIPKIIEDYWS